MNRREAAQKIGLAAGVFTALPSLALAHPSFHHGDDGWMWQAQGEHAPAFFTPAEYTSVVALCDRLIPASDTLGAVGAGVPQYLDMVYAAERDAGDKKSGGPVFKSGLALLLHNSQERYQKDFHLLSGDEQDSLLHALEGSTVNSPGWKFFQLAKSSTMFAYYTSKVGQVDELHYSQEYRTSYPGCTHPEHKL